MPRKVNFPARLKKAIKAQGLTVAEFRKETGYTKGYISKIVRGIHKPGFDALVLFCDVLHCSADYLLGRSRQL